MFDLVEQEGLLLGGSSGVNVAGAIRLARELGPGHTIVTVLCDGGARYASKLFNPAFLRSKNLPVPKWMETQDARPQRVRADMTEALFREDSYKREHRGARARRRRRRHRPRRHDLLSARRRPAGRPRPSDDRAAARRSPIVNTIYDADRKTILHVPAPGASALTPGDVVTAQLDWPLRYRRMRAHTALHLLSVAIPFPVTGGSVGDGEGRLDFDSGEAALDKAAIEDRLNEMIRRDAKISTRWITDEELLANPDLVKTMNVKPPMGTGRVRLVAIEGLDLQPCGGTHVASTGRDRPCGRHRDREEGADQPTRPHPTPRRLSGRAAPGEISMSENFVSTDWLAAQLGANDLGIIDASWHLPPTGRIGREEFLTGHIPGAVFFDIDTVADASTGLPHMLPDAGRHGQSHGCAGPWRRHALCRLRRPRPVRRRARLVDACAPTAHRNVALLDGGLPKWIAERPAARLGRRLAAAANLHPAPRS